MRFPVVEGDATQDLDPRPLNGDPTASVWVQRVVPSGVVRTATTGLRPTAAAMSPDGVMAIPKANPSASAPYVLRQSSVPSGAQRPMNESGSDPHATGVAVRRERHAVDGDLAPHRARRDSHGHRAHFACR